MGCNQTKNYSNNYSNYFNYFSKQSGQGRYLMRQLEETDVTNKNSIKLKSNLNKYLNKKPT